MTTRDNDETLLTRILESPRLPFYARQIQTVLNDEQDARHRFYEAITEGDKAEFINGEPVFHSPVRLEHNQVGQLLLTLLSTYVRINDLGYVGYEKIMISLSRNDYEPDLCYFRKETAAQFKPRQMHFPAPDFIVEILSESTAAHDRGVKLVDYAAHGVGEYWIIDPRPHQQQADFYVRDDEGHFVPAPVDSDGVYTSRMIGGFRLRVAWLWQLSLPNPRHALAEIMTAAADLPDELRALYREMARLLA